MNMTYFEAQKEAERILAAAGISEHEPDARLLLLYAADKTYTELLVLRTEEVPEHIRSRYFELIGKRAERKPLQYITGEAPFYGYSFKVNESVLIPRFDTEILVSEAVKYSKNARVLDICTGSGCIAISIFLAGGAGEVSASDISKAALLTAKENAVALGADINFIESNMFENVRGDFELIVSNPPYVTEEEYTDLEPEVKLHEPKTALTAPDDGLYFYEILAEACKTHLVQGGRIIVEIGESQAESVKRIFEKNGLAEITVIKDLAGLDRVVSAKKI